MEELNSPAAMRAWASRARADGDSLALVPTMGALHSGHLALIDHAAGLARRVVVSIFVNPLQFGPREDFAAYPRSLDRDRALTKSRGVDCLFVPSTEDMYPPDPRIRVTGGALGAGWEGAARRRHFDGVLTIVSKLFHLVSPDIAVFGRKDYQQAVLIRRLVRELDFPVAIEVAPTVREPDGLALSSRNAYLAAPHREAACSLSQALRAVEHAWRGGEHSGPVLMQVGRRTLERAAGVDVDYVAVVDPDTLAPLAEATARAVVLVAARVGRARLIDNVVLGEGLDADVTAGS